MDEFDEDEEECPGADECDDPDCDKRETYHVEIDWSVKFKIQAHSEEEANTIADDVALGLDFAEPGRPDIEEFEQGEDWRTVEHWSVIAQRAQEARATMAAIEAELEAEAASANPKP